MRRAAALAAALLGAGLCAARSAAPPQLHVLIVAGLGGEPRYEEEFSRDAQAIAKASRLAAGESGAGLPVRVTLLAGAEATSDAVGARLRALRSTLRPQDELALVLIGHGSYDGEQYKFNLPGSDLGVQALGRLLDALPTARQLVVNASSASGAALEPLRRKGRVLIAATRSGSEQTATQFGHYWAQALSSSEADLDKDGWITEREAFDFTARRVADHFKRDVSLATEHPQIAGEGAPFRIARLAGAREPAPGNPAAAEQLARRAVLERELAALRQRKDSMAPEVYRRELERKLLEIARLQEEMEAAPAKPPDAPREGAP